jgi:hypothetical protein
MTTHHEEKRGASESTKKARIGRDLLRVGSTIRGAL